MSMKVLMLPCALFTMARTDRKSYMDYRTALFFYDLEQSLTQFSRSRYTLTPNIS